MRLSELYTSVQGEGPRAGTPTQFVRFAGCNLRCPLWPCDTPHAIEPKIFEREQRILSPHELFEELPTYPKSLCLTGGEPFIQKHTELEEFTRLAMEVGYTVECFSNGTILYPQWALESINFIMDWKLPGSGEDHLNAVRIKNAFALKSTDYIKFVIAGWEDFVCAKQTWEHNNMAGIEATYSYGVAWGKMTLDELVGWVLEYELPWKLNVQVHNYIWPREKRGI